MAHLNETVYLNSLKESIKIPHNFSYDVTMDFSLSETYTGKETLGELLTDAGIDFNILEEGILSMPINKIKNMVTQVTANSGNIEGLKKTKKMLGGLANKVKPAELQKKIHSMGVAKGVDKKDIDSAFEKIMRLFGVANLVASFTNPLGWIVLIVALIKAGSLEEFNRGISEAINELGKSVSNTGSKFEDTMALQSTVMKMLLVCMIPPWIQAVVLGPIAIVYALMAYVVFVIEFLNVFGKER